MMMRMRPPRVRRLVQLYAGLVLFGVSSSMLLLAGLGVDPWDVFHQGLSRRLGLGVGTWAIIVGAAVLLLWIPLRQRPGFGTLSNVVVVGLVIDVMLAVVPPVDGLGARIVVMLGGVVLNGIATGAYIGAGLGPGPRDGLMTGLAARGHRNRADRARDDPAAADSTRRTRGHSPGHTSAGNEPYTELTPVVVPVSAVAPRGVTVDAARGRRIRRVAALREDPRTKRSAARGASNASVFAGSATGAREATRGSRRLLTHTTDRGAGRQQ